VAGAVSTVDAADLRHLAELAEGGTFKPVIDRSYPSIESSTRIAKSIPVAKRGSVVIKMGVV
jgi:NADPH:quinone reductase-like Zn-dependent oxidoreductase